MGGGGTEMHEKRNTRGSVTSQIFVVLGIREGDREKAKVFGLWLFFFFLCVSDCICFTVELQVFVALCFSCLKAKWVIDADQPLPATVMIYVCRNTADLSLSTETNSALKLSTL